MSGQSQHAGTGQPLGEPLPRSPHAVSVSLPKWADVVGYEKGEARVMNAMKIGYPRFFYNPITQKLFALAQKEFARADEFCLVFPSEKVAKQCVDYCLKQGSQSTSTSKAANLSLNIHSFLGGTWAVVFPASLDSIAKSFWQHAGFVVSSRQAEMILAHREPSYEKAAAAKTIVTSRLASLAGVSPSDVFLYPSGMAAIFTAFGLFKDLSTPAKPLATLQLGFPYVDTLKIQEKFGGDALFLNDVSTHSLHEAEKIIVTKKVTVIFTEFPCNPLIDCIELEKLSTLCRKYNVALVIDDTLSTCANIDLRPYADIIVSSLTKFFSGTGDVLAGALILNQSSIFYSSIKNKLQTGYEDLLYGEDAVVLEHNSRDFESRISKINDTAEKLYEFLKDRMPSGSVLYYTKGNPVYEKYKKRGYGGIISLVLPDAGKAQVFYDALDTAKGPSLGTNYTLVCPYTILAHYHERAFAERCGVPFHLIRISVGLEDLSELEAKFQKALDVQ